jgi:shikimate dehydrogenase
LAFARDSGFHGVNVTLPYKERAFGYVDIDDPTIRQLGSVNTICFEPDGLTGANTDFTGFLKSYRAARGDQKAGHVLLIGAGGVGRSIGFALTQLGAGTLTILDTDQHKAEGFVKAINQFMPGLAMVADANALPVFDALVNCSPAGMHGYGGLPLPERLIPTDFDWAFDAVYQPVETPFKQLIDAHGIAFISGFELFFHQGVDAFSIFTGFDVADEMALRDVLSRMLCRKDNV